MAWSTKSPAYNRARIQRCGPKVVLIILVDGWRSATNDKPKSCSLSTSHHIFPCTLVTAFERGGFCWGPKALRAPACKTGSQKPDASIQYLQTQANTMAFAKFS